MSVAIIATGLATTRGIAGRVAVNAAECDRAPARTHLLGAVGTATKAGLIQETAAIIAEAAPLRDGTGTAAVKGGTAVHQGAGRDLDRLDAATVTIITPLGGRTDAARIGNAGDSRTEGARRSGETKTQAETTMRSSTRIRTRGVTITKNQSPKTSSRCTWKRRCRQISSSCRSSPLWWRNSSRSRTKRSTKTEPAQSQINPKLRSTEDDVYPKTMCSTQRRSGGVE